MNRRSFIERLALGGASFMILPGAGRVWKATREPVIGWNYIEHPGILHEIADAAMRLYPKEMSASVDEWWHSPWSSPGHLRLEATRSQIRRIEDAARVHSIIGLTRLL